MVLNTSAETGLATTTGLPNSAHVADSLKALDRDFGKACSRGAPVVESAGCGGGLKPFCAAVSSGELIRAERSSGLTEISYIAALRVVHRSRGALLVSLAKRIRQALLIVGLGASALPAAANDQRPMIEELQLQLKALQQTVDEISARQSRFVEEVESSFLRTDQWFRFQGVHNNGIHDLTWYNARGNQPHRRGFETNHGDGDTAIFRIAPVDQ